MTVRQWTTMWAVALLAIPGTEVLAQRGAPMMVVIKLNEGSDPWLYGPRMAAATGMELAGVSASTNTAVFTVPNETDKAQGVVAGRNLKTLQDGFPGVVVSYNFGVNYPAPRDLQAPRPAAPPPPPPQADDRRGTDYRRGVDDRRGPNRFTGRDLQVVRDWYYSRRDSWMQLREGDILDAQLRAWSYPAPPELVRELNPVFRGGRYLIIGENLVLVDSRYYVVDLIRFSDLRDDRRGRGPR